MGFDFFFLMEVIRGAEFDVRAVLQKCNQDRQ